MLVKDAQKEVRTVYAGGFFGQLVSSTLWLVSAALGTWVSPHAAILELVCCGFFIFPITQLLLRISGRPASVRRENPLHFLGMQIAFTLPLSMLLLVPVCEFRLSLFYPALMILLGAHYLPLTFLYGMRMFLPLAAILIGAGVVSAHLLVSHPQATLDPGTALLLTLTEPLQMAPLNAAAVRENQ